MPARGNANGLHVDDLDDEEDENEEESEEFVSMSNVGKGSRLGGQQQIRTTDDSRIQSVLCMYFMFFYHHHFDDIMHIDEKVYVIG